jgi:general nucleoside transport system permease protein
LNESVLSRRSQWAEAVTLYVLCGLGALVISGLLVTVVGASWSDVWNALVDGSVRKPGRWGGTIGVATPLALVALGTMVSNRAGLVNIGQEGQLLIGAAFAAYAGANMVGPGPVALLVVLTSGALGGALWAGIAGGLRYWRKVPEVLSTLLLVSLAANVVGYGLKNSWLLLERGAGLGNRNSVSEQLAPDTRIPHWSLWGNDFAMSAVAVVLLIFLVSWMLNHTLWGYRLSVVGQNQRVARRFGIGETAEGMKSMFISGGMSGLAGGVMLASGDFANYRLVAGFSVSIGWVGLLVALVAGQRALAIIPVAFVFASLRTGSGFLASTGIERRVTDVVQGLIVLALLIPPAIMFIRQRRRALSASRSRV